jgi:O-methyltransferase
MATSSKVPLPNAMHGTSQVDDRFQSTIPHQLALQQISPERQYLDLLKKCLTRFLFPENYRPLTPSGIFGAFYPIAKRILARRNLEIVRRVHFDAQTRLDGSYLGAWPPEAETMIGVTRLDDIHHCIDEVLAQGVPGDFLEAGVWRGGAAIFMRAVLRAYHQTDRVVWLADSFQGLPAPQVERYHEDDGDNWTGHNDVFRIPLEQVKTNFARYDVLDDQVRFLAGWFKDTLPAAPIKRLAVLRLDCDMYSSTMDVLTNLYPKLSIGGYVIVDDYSLLPRCKQAVDDFRVRFGIDEELQTGGWHSVFWRRAPRS